MNDTRNGIVYGMLFIFFIVCLIVGGFFAMEYFINDNKGKVETPEKIEKKEHEVVAKDLKIDNSKDYIYFTNDDIINEEYSISYPTININIDSDIARETEKLLNEEINTNKSSYKEIKVETQEDNTDKETKDEEKGEDNTDTESDTSEVNYAKYTRYFSQDYVSLRVDNYSLDASNGEKFLNSKSYIFDTSTGNLLTNEEVFSIYDTNLENLKEKIKTHLENDTIIKESEDEKIDINSTLDNLENSYAIFIDNDGNLNISYLVKSNKKDYNDVIIID